MTVAAKFVTLLLMSLVLMKESRAQDLGLCYDRTSQTTPQQKGTSSKALTLIPTDVRHWLAMKASQLIYKLSDLETAKTGAQLVREYTDFRTRVLNDYEHWRYFSDRETGLKFGVFAPVNPEDPWIFAFAGTQSGLDWMSDVSLGRRQLQRVEEFADYFIDCRNVDRAGVPIAARNWIITGHSLGGGLAQAFAFKARSRRMLHRMLPEQLELVTFNGFGALDLLRPLSGIEKIETMQLLSTNYFVTGDVVSRIGKHLGPTFEIPMPAGVKPGAMRSHVMTTVEASVMAQGYPRFGTFKAAAPPTSHALQMLKSVGVYFEFLNETSSEKLAIQLQQAQTLRSAVRIVSARRASGKFDTDLLKYTRELAVGFSEFLKKMPQHDMRDPIIRDLENLQIQINRSLTTTTRK